MATCTTRKLDATSVANVQSLLASELTPAVQQALTRYNSTNAIRLVSPTGMLTYAISCASAEGTTGAFTTLSAISGFTAVEPPATKVGAAPPAAQMLYALSGGVLYQISTAIDGAGAPSAGATCYPLAFAGTTGVLAVAADGANLYALVSLIGGATQVVCGAAGGCERRRLAEDQDGSWWRLCPSRRGRRRARWPSPAPRRTSPSQARVAPASGSW